MSHYVYLIQSSNGYLKIGVASDPSQRLQDLQIGSPQLLTMQLTISAVSREAAFEMETMLHKRYAKQSVGGEWFDIPLYAIASEITWILKFASLADGVNRYHKEVAGPQRKERSARMHTYQRKGKVFGQSYTAGATELAENYFTLHPEHLNLPERELAQIIGVSKGTVGKVRQKILSQMGK